MRHKKKFNHLSRKRGHRQAMLSNMASSLIIHKRIKTTTAKAKALRSYVEPLITKSKEDTTHSRREVFSYLQDKEATAELFREVAVKVGERPGGYTRIIKLGNRLGDSAEMCVMELVDYNENLLAEKAAASKSSRRRRGGRKKSQAQAEGAVVDVAADQAEATGESTEAPEASEVSADTPEAAEAPESTEATDTREAPVEEVKEAPAAEAQNEEEKKEAPAEAASDHAEPEAEASGDEGSDEEKSDDTEEKKEE